MNSLHPKRATTLGGAGAGTEEHVFRWANLAILAVFALAAVVLFRILPAPISPDTISYLSIAKNYAAARWTEAVNVYWSPLECWLLSPLLALGAPDAVALKTVALISGLAALFGTILLSSMFRMTRQSRVWVTASAALMSLACMLETAGPDLLLAALLLFYFAILFSPRYLRSEHSAMGCGVLGALAFFAKSYAFFFFATHFTMVNAVYWLQSPTGSSKRQIIRNWMAGVAVFALASAPWIAAVSWKAGRPLLSTTGTYNYRIVGPESLGNPHMLGLLPPSSPYSVNAWENPRFDSLSPWSPLASAHALRHQITLIIRNARTTVRFWLSTSFLAITILVSYVLLWESRSGGYSRAWIAPILTLALYPAAYLLINVQDRYLYPTAFLLLVLALHSHDAIVTTASLSSIARITLFVILVASFYIAPVRRIAGVPRNDEIATLADRIHAARALQGRLASCGSWTRSMKLAYRLGQPYYGLSGPGIEGRRQALELNPESVNLVWPTPTPETAEAQLSRYQIDYLLVWNDCAVPPLSAISRHKILDLPDLKIYSVDKE